MNDKIVLDDWQWARLSRHLTDVGVDTATRNRVAAIVTVRVRTRRQCRPVTARLRARVRALVLEGYSQREIAEKVGRPRSTVQYILGQQLR